MAVFSASFLLVLVWLDVLVALVLCRVLYRRYEERMAEGGVESWYWGLGILIYPSFESCVVQVGVHFMLNRCAFHHNRGMLAVFHDGVKSFYVLLGRSCDISQSPAVLGTNYPGSWIVVDGTSPLFMIMQDCSHLPVPIYGLDCLPRLSHSPAFEEWGLVRGGYIFLQQGRTQEFHLFLVWVLSSVPCCRWLPYVPHRAVGSLYRRFLLAQVQGQDCLEQNPYSAASRLD